MKPSLSPSIKYVALALIAGALLTGCVTQSEQAGYSSDGGNALIVQESSNMGTVLNTHPLAKVSSEVVSDTGEVVVKHITLKADTTCLPGPCFIRGSEVTTPNGKFDRDRQDTIWLLDSTGAYMTTFRPFDATTIVYHRHVVKTKDDKSMDIQFNTTLTWGVDSVGNRVAVLNGTITGTINGEAVNATISDVMIPFVPGLGCGLPNEGMIHAERGGDVVDIDFEEGGKAHCDIKDDRGHHHPDRRLN